MPNVGAAVIAVAAKALKIARRETPAWFRSVIEYACPVLAKCPLSVRLVKSIPRLGGLMTHLESGKKGIFDKPALVN
ncbi:hypothetical protein [Roseovarius amoyensis]|uniref:hypothetical protein n=1 Tax=Roseovarius amoyensis TaxID=2211448 RepID=UPI0013A70590|nr:hypothetical protein [Roseovarius amoyensis]